MPTLAWNKQAWEEDYDWKSLGGNDWSAPWGDAETQWYASLYPRLHNFLPAGTILEIAPGAGRWTQFLLHHCEQLVAVDYSQKCVSTCQEVFASVPRATFHVNDGRSLDMIPDKSIDFVYSFDSLVHVEADVIESYLAELSKKLKPDGVGFIHHSNLHEYPWLPATDSFVDKRFLWRVRAGALRYGLWLCMHSRGRSMSARLFEEYCEKAGLQCIGQELINWDNKGVGTRFLIDCLSTFTPRGSTWARPNRVIKNPYFVEEARSILAQSSLYSKASFK